MTDQEAPGRMRMAFGEANLVDDAIICSVSRSRRLTKAFVDRIAERFVFPMGLPLLIDMGIADDMIAIMKNGLLVATIEFRGNRVIREAHASEEE